MTDPTFFRARLNGASVEDTLDTAPSGERQAIVTYIDGDSDVDGSTTILGKARVYLPNNVPCPLYAANMHFFGKVGGPSSVPIARAVQPKVIIRRDVTVDPGDSAEMAVVITPTLFARAVQKWGGGGHNPAKLADMVELKFYDGVDGVASTKLGYFQNFGGTANEDIIQPDSIVAVSTRTSVVTTGLPSGYHHAWLVAPLNAGNTCPCKITGGGPGATYTASFYAMGPGAAATETGVTVTQLMIDSGETIPTNTWVIATRIAGAWYVQAPVWLA